MAAVNEYGELDARRPAEVRQGVHRGADAASGVENIVDEHDAPAVDVNGQLGALETGTELERRNVSQRRYRAHTGRILELAYLFGEAVSERDTRVYERATAEGRDCVTISGRCAGRRGDIFAKG
jgi:hypothetical protein